MPSINNMPMSLQCADNPPYLKLQCISISSYWSYSDGKKKHDNQFVKKRSGSNNYMNQS